MACNFYFSKTHYNELKLLEYQVDKKMTCIIDSKRYNFTKFIDDNERKVDNVTVDSNPYVDKIKYSDCFYMGIGNLLDYKSTLIDSILIPDDKKILPIIPEKEMFGIY
jgi:hypothetical protein